MKETYAQSKRMTEAEFAAELQNSLLILSTSSPDKRNIYRQLFSSFPGNVEGEKGLNLLFTDSGALKIVPRKTPEMNGDYGKNLEEKALLQLHTLQDPSVQESIRRKVIPAGSKDALKIMGMTEDSGWSLVFDNDKDKARFISRITEKLESRLRNKNELRLDSFMTIGFPGPDLKPIQEHLEGGFHGLMSMIYETASETGIHDLRYKNTVSVSFSSPDLNKYFTKELVSTGSLLSKAEYSKQLLALKSGEAINSDFVQIPDGQPGAARMSVDALVKEHLYTRSSHDLPAQWARRDLTKYLQDLIGARATTEQEKERSIKIAYVNALDMEGGEQQTPAIKPTNVPDIKGFEPVGVPTERKLMEQPNIKIFGDADVVVLMPKDVKAKDSNLTHNPNHALVLEFVVAAETVPECMGIPIVLDNRSGRFNNELKLITDAFAQGRLMGNTPFHVAHTKEELKSILKEIRDVKRRAPVISTLPEETREATTQPLPAAVPKDGVFTVFIGGGHTNNSKRDKEDAEAFGYHCAKMQWRIVTGAGSIEGSMGAVHTGFVQYYLDELQAKYENGSEKAFKVRLKPYFNAKSRKYDAEKLILANPKLVDELADCEAHFIPRNMFYGYSMKPLLEMESPSHEPPPGITYAESGNMIRRLSRLLASGSKVILSGGIGTDQEFVATVKQHLEARLNDEKRIAAGLANDNSGTFADGTPDSGKDSGTLIIYNKGGQLDRLLQNYGLLGDGPITTTKKEEYNIIVVDSLKELKAVTSKRAASWEEHIRPSIGGNAQEDTLPARGQKR